MELIDSIKQANEVIESKSIPPSLTVPDFDDMHVEFMGYETFVSGILNTIEVRPKEKIDIKMDVSIDERVDKLEKMIVALQQGASSEYEQLILNQYLEYKHYLDYCFSLAKAYIYS